MGSQTLVILRQVWASLTGGYYFDPESSVFCNVVHLYLWLFLFLFPFVAYLYFPGTWLTIYAILTSVTILGVKLINMALHRLYDRAQSMSETNLKNQFFKITKETETREDDTGIEMKVMGNNGSRGSVENAIHEESDENSMISMENLNGIMDLTVDVHRKNSSGSTETLFYPPSRGSQQDQHSIAGSASVSKILRSNNTITEGASNVPTGDKYLTVYPEHEQEITKDIYIEFLNGVPATAVTNTNATISTGSRQSNLLRKSSEDFKRRQQQRRLERKRSLETAPYTELIPTRMVQGTPDSIAMRHDTFLHSQAFYQNTNVSSPKLSNASATPLKTTPKSQRLSTNAATANIFNTSSNVVQTSSGRCARLQRHRSSETHDERLKQQSRGGIYLPISNKSMHNNELNQSLAGALQSCLLGSSSDVYMEDDNRTKSDYGIEQLEDCVANNAGCSTFLLQQQQQLTEQNPKDPRFRHQRRGGIKRRRHSNATSMFKGSVNGGNIGNDGILLDDIDGIGDLGVGSATPPTLGSTPQTSVRRIKSTALEISCPRPSISNLSPHPNSVEAINGQQQIRNTTASLLPPPSKSLVRNPHLTLCPKFGGSFGGNSGSGNNLTFGVNTSSDSTLALIEPVYPIVESGDEKRTEKTKQQKRTRRINDCVDRQKKESVDCDIDVQSIIETAMQIRDGHVDEDDDDAVDDVPVQRRRKALGCRQDRRSVESDVGEILADDDDEDVDADEFKDFDDNNLELILQDLQHTQNQLDDLKAAYEQDLAHKEANNVSILEVDLQGKHSDGDDDVDDPSGLQEVVRERLHSTDSETDNKGSRSPLLSGKKWDSTHMAAKEADKALHNDIMTMKQKHRQTPPAKRALSLQKPPQLQNLQTCGEGDSGCPSSDCEQISASSKDMLLSGLDGLECADEKSRPAEGFVKASTTKDAEEGKVVREIKASESHSKQLGAIPKTIKYREVDETTIGRNDGPSTSAAASSSSQLHKRRGGNIKNSSSCTTCTTGRGQSGGTHDDRSLTSVTSTKAISRTSSSTSSCSLNAYSFSSDMHKMLWFLHGGAIDERGRPIAGEGISLPAPTNMSRTQVQKYYDAFQTEGLSLSEYRQYAREKMRRCSKHLSYLEFPLQPTQLNTKILMDGGPMNCDSGSGRTSLHHHSPFGVVSTSSALNSRNASNAATISMQGLFDAINEERNAANQARVGGSAVAGSTANSAAAAILNVENSGHMENYCDFWRPTCMLSSEKPVIPKSFYKYQFSFCGFEHDFKISMDRLELLALFDRDLHWIHIILSVILCATVAFLGATVLQHGYYKDLFALVFCAVIAGSQYSLVKSVQPDAASPIHGFNKTVAYSRAIYFCLCGGLLLIFENLKKRYEVTPPQEFIFFGIVYSPADLNLSMLEIMYILLLCFPIIFSLGLFPQINTFLMYFLEQVDMHIFGGNAAGSLLGAFFCVVRSVLGVCILYGPLYAALADGRGTQYIVFSIFCAMLIPLGYHLSRSASDLSHLWALIKTCIVSTYRDDDDELSASGSGVSSQKLTLDTPKKRNKRSLEQELPPAEGNNEHIEMSSIEKIPSTDGRGDESRQRYNNLESKGSKSKASSLGSSSQALAKTKSISKKVTTDSNSYISMDGALCVNMGDNVVVSRSERDLTENLKSSNATNEGSIVLPIVNVERQDKNDLDAEGDEVDKVSTSSTTNPGDMSTLTAGGVGDVDGIEDHGNKIDNESPDPLPKKLQMTVNTRLKNDFVVMTFLALVVLGLHSSTVFTVLQPDLNIVLYVFTSILGLVLHYIIPQMRKHMPWLCFSRPLLRQREFGQFEVANAPKIMWFEKAYIYLCMVERNVLFPLLVISALTADAQTIAVKYGIAWGTLIVAVCALKFIRNAYSDPTNQYLIVIFTVLLFRVDFAVSSETFLVDYLFVSIAYRKCCDFLLKLQFIVTYIAPWQITWGSAFHAFAQPFSVPHSAMLFLQAGVSAAFSTPLNPFLGSAIFLTSYVRPIKFWERDYNTRRIDHSNTRLVSQLERDLGADDNNLNSIFYEHLTRSLQHSLCGDLLLGRWGNVNQGDCFVLASDYLNCLVHIIEVGNGLCTFQMRGLEFRGTYCQQREVEAITEGVEDNDGCCCCDPGHLPRMLSANAMFSTRWLAWQVVAAQYVLEGYSISDNLASATLQVFEYRKVLITYYVKSIIYYVLKNPKLEQWLSSGPIQDALLHTLSRQFVDLDPIFNHNLDEDFDFRAMGITRSSFCHAYLNWIDFCYDKRKENQSASHPSPTPKHTPGLSSSNANNNSNNDNNNDSKSTPNLSTATLAASANPPHTAKSQSQQQLRTRPQKSATMSNSAIVNNNSGDHMASSQSYANILRQTSESAPGLSGAGLGFALTATTSAASATAPVAQSCVDSNSLNNSTTVIDGGSGNSASLLRTPLSLARGSSMKTPKRCSDNKPSQKEMDSSPLPPLRFKEGEGCEKPIQLKVPTVAKDSPIVSLCLSLSLLARRSLATASHGSITSVEFFLHGLHALFKGDFRITSPRDEWVFADMELLHSVVAPAVKMSLKLQQDHISNPDEFLDPESLYCAIETCSKDLVISHEADPVWRSAVLRGAPNLLALRHVMEDGSDEYRIIRLAKRFLSFRVIKLNRECVRGLWAGQQQELIYLRNRNPERGSIQNAKQALRNIINSSCDQPIGYPIYVSPLTTSYADTNEQVCQIIGGAITLESIKSTLLDWWHHIRERCRQGCSSGSAMGPSGESTEIAPVCISAPLYNTLIVNNCLPSRTTASGVGASLSSQYGSDGLASSIRGTGVAVWPLKPTSTTLFATFLNRDQEAVRELRGLKKSQTQGTHSVTTAQRGERERRATLPIASTSMGVVGTAITSMSSNDVPPNEDSPIDVASTEGATGRSSPHYAKISSSSGSLGIGNIITTPGDYPRKTKGPICLATVSAGLPKDPTKLNENTTTPRKPRIELLKKVIIVDGTEIYDCLDLGRRIDIIWPSEEMRLRGGHMSWKDWVPRVGMVGLVVHYWIPNHYDYRFRSHVDRIVYLVEIGEHLVPVGEYGIREYNQILGDEISGTSSSMTTISSRHSLMHYHHELDELRQQRDNLTPIASSDFETPTAKISDNVKIQAVSSSSSEDDYDTKATNIETHKRDVLKEVLEKIEKDRLQGKYEEPKESWKFTCQYEVNAANNHTDTEENSESKSSSSMNSMTDEGDEAKNNTDTESETKSSPTISEPKSEDIDRLLKVIVSLPEENHGETHKEQELNSFTAKGCEMKKGAKENSESKTTSSICETKEQDTSCQIENEQETIPHKTEMYPKSLSDDVEDLIKQSSSLDIINKTEFNEQGESNNPRVIIQENVSEGECEGSNKSSSTGEGIVNSKDIEKVSDHEEVNIGQGNECNPSMEGTDEKTETVTLSCEDVDVVYTKFTDTSEV